LDEPREALKVHALERLHAVVDNEWAEVASAIATIEALYEDEEFSSRCEAALLASKVRAKTTRGARVICGLDQIPSFG